MKTIELPDQLARRIEMLATGSNLKPQAIIKAALARYEESLRREVEEGFASGEKEGWVPAEQVFADAHAIIEKHAKRQAA